MSATPWVPSGVRGMAHSSAGDPLECAVVLNMYATGLGIARNLARHRVPVYGLSAQVKAPGNYSRACRALACPDSQNEPDRLAAALLDLADTLPGRPVLFPTRDADVLFLDRNRASLEPRYRIPQLEGDSLDLVMNKHRLAEAARAARIASPRTARVRSREELAAAAGVVRYPLVVKPSYAQQWRVPGAAEAVARRKAILASSHAEVEEIYRRLEPYAPDLILQEWVDGPDDHCYVLGCYRSKSGAWLGWFTARKILQFPPEFGLGCVVRLVSNPEVRDLGMRLLESLAFWGTAEVEFKLDPITRTYRLIEVNPRHWDQHALGMACGVNLAYLAYSDLCGLSSPHPSEPNGGSAYWISGEGLFRSITADLKRFRFYPHHCTGLIRPGTRFSVWDPADPLPFLRMFLAPRAV
jgi:D-aspartate ligase